MALLPSDPQQQRKLLIGLVPLLGLFAYWYFYHGDKKAEIASLESRLESLESKNAAARARAQRGGPELERTLAEYERYIVKLEELVPDSEEIPELLHMISVQAQQYGVELARLTPHNPEPGDFYMLQTHDVAVFGKYHDIGRFLAAVGSLPRIVTPVNLVLVPRQGSDGTADIQATFRIKTYVIPEGGNLAANQGGPNGRG